MLTPAAFFKALSDDTRCKLLLLIIEEEELCVCELSHALTASQPKVSRHLAQLRATGLLTDRRQGQWVFYRLNEQLQAWALHLLQEFYQVQKNHIHQERDQLATMGERPERQAQCCEKV